MLNFKRRKIRASSGFYFRYARETLNTDVLFFFLSLKFYRFDNSTEFVNWHNPSEFNFACVTENTRNVDLSSSIPSNPPRINKPKVDFTENPRESVEIRISFVTDIVVGFNFIG